MRNRLVPPPFSSTVVAHARGMRFQQTDSEAALWRQLSGRKLAGVQFRRQVPVGPFIADFLAPRFKLIVEVDGACHAQRAAADARRDRKLRRWGYEVLRVDAELVLRDMPAALQLIRAALCSGA